MLPPGSPLRAEIEALAEGELPPERWLAVADQLLELSARGLPKALAVLLERLSTSWPGLEGWSWTQGVPGPGAAGETCVFQAWTGQVEPAGSVDVDAVRPVIANELDRFGVDVLRTAFGASIVTVDASGVHARPWKPHA